VKAIPGTNQHVEEAIDHATKTMTSKRVRDRTTAERVTRIDKTAV